MIKTSPAALLFLWASAAVAGEPETPLQADMTIGMPRHADATGEFSTELEPGGAMMIGRVRNRDDLRTAIVDLRFVYRVPPDVIAFDEILDAIELSIADRDGNRIAEADLDPHEAPLNPNGPKLVYRFTMYRPTSAYKLRVRVFGNYE